ncbi:hypothetical protein VNI00_007995, partial [Paramarasmius palmivorus]
MVLVPRVLARASPRPSRAIPLNLRITTTTGKEQSPIHLILSPTTMWTWRFWSKRQTWRLVLVKILCHTTVNLNNMLGVENHVKTLN